MEPTVVFAFDIAHLNSTLPIPAVRDPVMLFPVLTLIPGEKAA
jgi:hypothetical protein